MKKKKDEVQIGRRSIKIWYDKEIEGWKASVMEWNSDHWNIVTTAEAPNEKVIRDFYNQEVEWAKNLLGHGELLERSKR